MANVCDCPCHTKGVTIMHFMACCDICGVQYINTDGTYDHSIIDKFTTEPIARKIKAHEINMQQMGEQIEDEKLMKLFEKFVDNNAKK